LIPAVLAALSIGVPVETRMLVVLVMIIAQINDNFVVVPVILARAANLHPLITLIGVIAGGNFLVLPV